MNPKRLYKVFLIITFLVFQSCKNELTPEETVEQFRYYLHNGECEKALEISTGDAEYIVLASMDMGCKEVETRTDSIICSVQGDNAICDCYGQGFWLGDFPFHFTYGLKRIDGEWKVNHEVHPEWEDEVHGHAVQE